LKVRDLPKLLKETMVQYSLPMFAVACAGIMGWLIGYLHAPELVANFIMGITTSSTGLFVLLILFLLIIGPFLSPLEAIIIFLPIITRLGDLANLDPVRLGIITCLVLACGMVTPPYGICLLIATQIGKISTVRAFVSIMPILLITIGIILIGVFVPDLFLFLPNWLMPRSEEHTSELQSRF